MGATDNMAESLPVHVTVVIPTRNEEAAIVDTIRSVPNDGWCDKLDFLIVDGNPSEVITMASRQENHLHVVKGGVIVGNAKPGEKGPIFGRMAAF